MIKRIVCDIVLFASLFLAPWWGTAILAVVFMVLFRHYWEGVVAAVFIDTLYSIPNTKIYGRFGIFTISTIILFFILNIIKKKIRFFA
ncbi:MAG: hypothetical protein HY773_00465 [Candidatus Terrybacteria bacterium]|nr:hypothetical protein [Candidatus Terrybacteria bacterium]MBI4812051.1 hypothetical protein [Candidatus Falkowbacteria bacterium]